jgi:hypothetical protein
MKKHFAVFLVAATASAAYAQWLKYPTPGIPRGPDGKPNLTAPAPRTPDGKLDLSGLWRKREPSGIRSAAPAITGGPIIPQTR